MEQDKYGEDFQQKSKYKRYNLPRHYLDFRNKPTSYKIHDNALERISLPREFSLPFDSLKKVLDNRESRRTFSNEPLSLQELSTLLKYTTGIRNDDFYPGHFNPRSVPSAGGLYPYETYLVINNVDVLRRGLYHYNIIDHSVDLLSQGDYSGKLSMISLDQKMAKNCAVGFMWSANVPRSRWKYLQRCYRYVYIDIGHVGQNFYLLSEALGLSCCTIGAIYDDEGNEFLGLDGVDETLIYIGVIGRRKE